MGKWEIGTGGSLWLRWRMKGRMTRAPANFLLASRRTRGSWLVFKRHRRQLCIDEEPLCDGWTLVSLQPSFSGRTRIVLALIVAGPGAEFAGVRDSRSCETTRGQRRRQDMSTLQKRVPSISSGQCVATLPSRNAWRYPQTAVLNDWPQLHDLMQS